MNTINHQPIIIGSVHYNTLGLLRSFGEEGFKPTLVLICNCDSDINSFVTKCRYIGKRYYTKEHNLIETLIKIKDENQGDMLFPTGDSVANIIDEHYDILSLHYIVPNIAGNGNNLKDANNKEYMRLRAEKYGFKTPQTWIIKSVDEINSKNLVYPVLIKPIHSQDAPKDIKTYYAPEELIPVIKGLLENTTEVQIQTFIKKEKEIIYLGWATNDDICIPCLMEKIREYPLKFGGTGFGYFITDINKYFDIAKLKDLLKSYYYTGLFSVEFIVENKTPFFLEINFRNDGNGYFPGYGGVNLPVQLFLKCYGKDITPDQLISKPFYMMREYNDYKWHQECNYSFRKWVCDIIKTSVFQYWNKKDIRPFFSFFKEHVEKSILGKIKNHRVI